MKLFLEKMQKIIKINKKIKNTCKKDILLIKMNHKSKNYEY